MTPDQLQTFLEHNRKDTTEVVERVVNGKIRDLTKLVQDHNARHEEDMADLKPIIIEFQEKIATRAFFKRNSEVVVKTAGVIGAMGVIWLFVKSLLK